MIFLLGAIILTALGIVVMSFIDTANEEKVKEKRADQEERIARLTEKVEALKERVAS